MHNWVGGGGIPCSLCGLDAMATAKTWCSYLKQQGCAESRRRIVPKGTHSEERCYDIAG
jgi:hypothetical protein